MRSGLFVSRIQEPSGRFPYLLYYTRTYIRHAEEFPPHFPFLHGGRLDKVGQPRWSGKPGDPTTHITRGGCGGERVRCGLAGWRVDELTSWRAARRKSHIAAFQIHNGEMVTVPGHTPLPYVDGTVASFTYVVETCRAERIHVSCLSPDGIPSQSGMWGRASRRLLGRSKTCSGLSGDLAAPAGPGAGKWEEFIS